MKGEFNIWLEGEALKKDKKLYMNKAREDYEDQTGMHIHWSTAEIEDFYVSDNEIEVCMNCRGVNVTVKIPISFEKKLEIARMIKKDMDALRDLNMI